MHGERVIPWVEELRTKDWLAKLKSNTWYLNACDNCRFVMLYQEDMRFGMCPRCSHGLLYYVMDVSLTVSENDYVFKDIVATEQEIKEKL